MGFLCNVALFVNALRLRATLKKVSDPTGDLLRRYNRIETMPVNELIEFAKTEAELARKERGR